MGNSIYKIPLKTVDKTYDIAGKLLIVIAAVTIAFIVIGGGLIYLVNTLSGINLGGM